MEPAVYFKAQFSPRGSNQRSQDNAALRPDAQLPFLPTSTVPDADVGSILHLVSANSITTLPTRLLCPTLRLGHLVLSLNIFEAPKSKPTRRLPTIRSTNYSYYPPFLSPDTPTLCFLAPARTGLVTLPHHDRLAASRALQWRLRRQPRMSSVGMCSRHADAGADPVPMPIAFSPDALCPILYRSTAAL